MWQSRMVPSVSLLERLSQMAPPQGEFEIQMEVGPGGMEDGHVAPPQGGSYNAMWQEGGKGGKGTCGALIGHLGNQSSGFSPPSALFEFLNGLLFLKKARSDMCLLLF